MSKRPFKIIYTANGIKVSRVVSCGSPESVVKSAALAIIAGRAEHAYVWVDQAKFATMSVRPNGDIHFEVY